MAIKIVTLHGTAVVVETVQRVSVQYDYIPDPEQALLNRLLLPQSLRRSESFFTCRSTESIV